MRHADLFDKGLAVALFVPFRSALASYHVGFGDSHTISTSSFLAKLVRSFFLNRPPVKILIPVWSLPAVLHALAAPLLEPLSEASMHILTLKAVFLVAIASGHRAGTIAALSIDKGHIRWEPLGVRLVHRPGYIAKNQEG